MIQSKTIELIISMHGKTTCLVASVLRPDSDYVCKRVSPTQRRHPFSFPEAIRADFSEEAARRHPEAKT